MAKICSNKKIRLIHVSTDAIFNGERGGYSEDSSPDPINFYAKTKLEGEKFVSSKTSDYVVIRTNFYGLSSNGNGLLNWILRNLVNKKKFMGFDDVVFNPLWVGNLAECLVRLADIPYTGILNVAGNQTLSKYEFAITVAENLGYKDAKIKKVSSDQMPSLVARRPKKTQSKTHAGPNIHSCRRILEG